MGLGFGALVVGKGSNLIKFIFWSYWIGTFLTMVLHAVYVLACGRKADTEEEIEIDSEQKQVLNSLL